MLDDARTRRALTVGLFVTVALLYAQTVGFAFVNWDDDTHVLANPFVRAPSFLDWRFWLTPSFGYPISVPVLSWWIDRLVHGFRPAGYHAGNVLLHALNAVLAMKLLERLRLPRGWALVGALLFASHPLTAEPVAWVTGRKDLLAATFGLASLLAWLRPTPSGRSDALANLLFTLSALSQPAVFALPVFALILRARAPGTPVRRALVAVLPSLLVVVGLAVASIAVGSIAIRPEVHAPLPLRAFRTIGYSLRLIFPPWNLEQVYVTTPARWRESSTAMGLLALLALGSALASPRVRSTRAFPLLLLLGAAAAPIANVIPLAKELGDAHLYLPLVPVGGLCALGLSSLTAQLRPLVRGAVALALPIVFVPFTLAQTTTWTDSTTLWTTMFARHPDVDEVCSHLGIAYAQDKRPDLAFSTFEACVAAHPLARDFYLYNMLLAARDAGEADKFRTLLAEFVTTHPDHPLSRQVRARATGGSDVIAPPAVHKVAE